MLLGEILENFGWIGVILVIYLGVCVLCEIECQLMLYYGVDCLVVVVYCVGWFDQMILCGMLLDIYVQVCEVKLMWIVLILVGFVLGNEYGFLDLVFYDVVKFYVFRLKVKVQKGFGRKLLNNFMGELIF